MLARSSLDQCMVRDELCLGCGQMVVSPTPHEFTYRHVSKRTNIEVTGYLDQLEYAVVPTFSIW